MDRFVSAAALLLLAAAPVSAQEMMRLPPPLPAGTPAPNFTSYKASGGTLTLKSLRGKVVLLDYWATWCGPCRMATPMLESLHKQFARKGLAVVGMSVDDGRSIGLVKPFMKRFGVTYTVTGTKQANSAAEYVYHVNGSIPAQFLLDKKGIVRWSQSGYSPGEKAELTPLITRLLAER